IIQAMPYDRPQTTMRGFPLCPACQHEYDDPLDRRFHAQPNACPVCGPRAWLAGREDVLARASVGKFVDDLARTAALLRQGHIVAVKGLGGFHLACDATDAAAVARLRARKQRPDKPFAVMVASLEQARVLCTVSEDEAALLSAVNAPVVLLYSRADSPIAPNVAPDNPMLGLMLAYTPLHHLLLRDAGRPLVMTSGNLSDLPIIADNTEAQEKLAGIADAFLLHDRPIHMRCDDAVWWVDRFAGEGDTAHQPLRRSRGDAPYPVRLVWPSETDILATGAEMKNTLCLLRGQDAFLSQHIGEVDSLESLAYFRAALEHLSGLFKVQPGVIAHDLHPDYLTTRLARDLAAESDLPRLPVQHHHAHIAACLAEHGHAGPVIGIAFDGTGYGPDGAIWGGEVLVADVWDFERVAHLEYLPLPGGAAAIRRPYRIAWGYLWETLGEIPQLPTLSRALDGELSHKSHAESHLSHVSRAFDNAVSHTESNVSRVFDSCVSDDITHESHAKPTESRSESHKPHDPAAPESHAESHTIQQERQIVIQQVQRRLNTPLTSSAGRLFDAVAAMLGLCLVATFEAQAAIALELAARQADLNTAQPYPFMIAGGLLRVGPLLAGIVADAQAGRPVSEIAAAFHVTLAAMVVAAAEGVRESHGLATVALSGGVFQNRLFLRLARERLRVHGFTVLTHRQVPANDGGLSLGQVVIALHTWRERAV
ncbi:MAG: carbamoyltransferase HypF, partial [Anaerolineae bacterium]|nr:carbamoyltransferase HypF [Anaerolineae bacterium]